MALTSAAVRYWSANLVRRRWRGLVLLGLMAGLGAGLTTAAIVGANRTGTAYTRMRRAQLAADAVVFPSQVGIGDADVSKLGTLPEVAAWAGFAVPDAQFDELPPGAGPILAVGDDWFTSIEKAKVLAGRLPDPARDDEAVVNTAAGPYAQIGRELTLRTYSPQDLATLGETTPQTNWKDTHGPVTKIKIVGIVRLPMESVVSFAFGPELIVGPGYMAAHEAQIDYGFKNALVRLRHGGADVPALQADVARLYGRDDIPVQDLRDDIKRVDNALGVERTAMLLFAAAVALATLVLVGQGFARSAAADADDIAPLGALGLTRPELTNGLVLPHGVTLATAAVAMVATTVVLSGRFPIALARRLDPDVGVRFDGVPILIGLLVLAAVLAASAWLSAWFVVRALTGHRSTRRTHLAGAAIRAGAPVPVAIGASFALERGVGRSAAPVRPALVSAVVAVIGVVGAVTLLAGINDALATPARVGTVWDLEATPQTNADIKLVDGQVTAPSLAADRATRSMALVTRFPSTVDGQDAPLYGLRPMKGSLQFVLLKGRPPASLDEIALGPRTAALVHAGVGSEVELGGGSRARVVGIALLPQTPHTSFDQGAWVLPGVVDRISGQPVEEQQGTVLIKLAPGTNVDAAATAMGPLGYFAQTPASVPDVANLSSVRSLPMLLAGFLILLALGAVGHALLSGSKRRAWELAVLRALGLTPKQAGACIGWQAAVVALVGLAVGVPLGLALGRVVWHRVADAVPIVYIGPFSPWALVAMPATLLALALLALLPARSAARLPTAQTLHAE